MGEVKRARARPVQVTEARAGFERAWSSSTGKAQSRRSSDPSTPDTAHHRTDNAVTVSVSSVLALMTDCFAWVANFLCAWITTIDGPATFRGVPPPGFA